MASQACPHLGTLDGSNRRAPHVEFPSFENYCLADATPELVMLADQATYCLSGACAACPRFHPPDAQQVRPSTYVPFYTTAEEAWQKSAPNGAGVVGLGPLDDQLDGQPSDTQKRWARLGAALIFLAVLACGSITAAYSGWQWMTRDLRQANGGRVDTVAAARVAATAPVPAVYVVMTATPMAGQPAAGQIAAPGNGVGSGAGGAGGTSAGQVAGPATGPVTGNGIIPVLPAAVTPTPIRVEIGAPVAAAPGGPGDAGASNSPGDPGTPVVDVGLLVPTRRPTPEFDLPTSTPLPGEVAATATLSPTAPPPLGTPIIYFKADKPELMAKDCTLVRWQVENVREIYYENLPVTGKGSKRECISDHQAIYTLRLILGDGQTQIVTTTVEYLPPTPTVTLTPTFTPEPVYTPTWTPVPPTPTQLPNLVYAVHLGLNGSSDVTCTPGQSCEVGLLVTNAGTGVDNLTVLLQSAGPFPAQLCRPDGVCGGQSIPITSMGPGNTAYVVARISPPADAAAGSSGSYVFQARSDSTGILSDAVTVNVKTP